LILLHCTPVGVVQWVAACFFLVQSVANRFKVFAPNLKLGVESNRETIQLPVGNFG
jgi:hypothetical protein